MKVNQLTVKITRVDLPGEFWIKEAITVNAKIGFTV